MNNILDIKTDLKTGLGTGVAAALVQQGIQFATSWQGSLVSFGAPLTTPLAVAGVAVVSAIAQRALGELASKIGNPIPENIKANEFANTVFRLIVAGGVSFAAATALSLPVAAAVNIFFLSVVAEQIAPHVPMLATS